jgi:hypothetical protein
MQGEGASHRSALQHLFETAGESHKKIRKTTPAKDLQVTISFYGAVSSGLTTVLSADKVLPDTSHYSFIIHLLDVACEVQGNETSPGTGMTDGSGRHYTISVSAI